MSGIIKNPRNGCALQGALQTVQEIKGAVPVVHANAGCGVVNYLANKASGQANSSYSGYSIPGTAVQDRHVIFGGASRLREQIKNTIKVVDGELYVILNSCESAMVGDDVDAMTREIVEQGEPVVDTLVAGFNGGTHYGYEHVLADILKSIDGVKKSEQQTDKKLINIFGIVPQKDPYWQGNLEELSRILESVGLKVNIFFGNDGGVSDLISAKNASLSIVFGRWGELPAKVLEEKWKVPVLYKSSLPVSAEDEIELINQVTEFAEVDEELKNTFFEKETRYEQGYLRRILEDIFDNNLGKKAVIISDEINAISIAKVLKNIFGVQIEGIVLTDALKKDEDHITDNEQLLKELGEKVYKTSDQKDIDEIIRSLKPEIIIGSSLERPVADQGKLPLLELSYPIYRKSVLNQATIGTSGEIGLVQDFITTIKQYEDNKKKELLAFVHSVKGGHNYEKQYDKKIITDYHDRFDRSIASSGLR